MNRISIIPILPLFLFSFLPALQASSEQKICGDYTYQLYLPAKYSPAKNYPLVLALHWSGARGADMIERWGEQAEKYSFIVAAPDAKNPQVWDTDEDTGILEIIKDIKQQYSIDNKNVFVTGFSAGGTMAYYLGLQYPSTFSGCAPIGASLKWLIDEKLVGLTTRKKIPFYLVHGSLDNTVDIQESRFAQQILNQYGYEVTFRQLSGIGHEYRPQMTWPIAQWFDKIRNFNNGDRS